MMTKGYGAAVARPCGLIYDVRGSDGMLVVDMTLRWPGPRPRPCRPGMAAAAAVIEAMIAGERDPRALAALGRGRMRNGKLPALAEALSGMRFGPQHAHAAASLPRATGPLDAELADLEQRVTAHLAGRLRAP